MFLHHLQAWFLPGSLVALAAIGLALLRSELRGPGRPLFQSKRKGRPCKSAPDKNGFRKAS